MNDSLLKIARLGLVVSSVVRLALLEAKHSCRADSPGQQARVTSRRDTFAQGTDSLQHGWMRMVQNDAQSVRRQVDEIVDRELFESRDHELG